MCILEGFLSAVGRTGAVGSASDFGPRGPWFDSRQGRRLLWPWASRISTAQYVYMYHMFLVSRNKKLYRAYVDC